ncbi:MAG: glycosyltransferase family 4 protein [Calditrichia bacterium]|jgi:glycosyltransferase involved in cell wall biosynthesis|nr:glycosyltransferase family 4 protein [Calditrichia bacterium]
MKIGMILDHVFPPDDRVEKEALSLIEDGHEVYILCFGSKETVTTSLDFKGIHLVKINVSINLMKKLRALTNTIINIYPYYWHFHIVKFIHNYDIQVLHIHDLYMLPSGFLALDKLPEKIPIVGDLHENYADALSSYRFSSTFPGNLIINLKKWKNSEKMWLNRLDYVITVVEEMKNRITPYVKNRDNIFILENAVDIDEFINFEKDLSIIRKFSKNFVISYIGGFDYHRGIDTIIEALSYLTDLSDLILILVGKEKNSNRIHHLIDKLGIRNMVSFEGFKPQGVLQNYFVISDIGIIPHIKSVQTDNSHPNKLSQYMLMGVPIIASNCDSIKNVIETSKVGLIYESKNAKDLAQKIRELYKNPTLRHKFSLNGKNAAKKRYNWSYNSRNLKKLYNIIENNRT